MGVEDYMDGGRFAEEWQRKADEYAEKYPISPRQAEVLALSSTGLDLQDMASVLGIDKSTVDSHRSLIKERFSKSRSFIDAMGPSSGGIWEEFERESWIPVSHVRHEAEDESGRKEIEYKLYRGKWRSYDHTYLLIEREITEENEWKTTETTSRSRHGSEALRNYLYSNADDHFQYYMCWHLLQEGGVDPGAEGAIHPRNRFGFEISEDKMDSLVDRTEETVQEV